MERPTSETRCGEERSIRKGSLEEKGIIRWNLKMGKSDMSAAEVVSLRIIRIIRLEEARG